MLPAGVTSSSSSAAAAAAFSLSTATSFSTPLPGLLLFLASSPCLLTTSPPHHLSSSSHLLSISPRILLQELAVEEAMRRRQNCWVDGSLRNAVWFSEVFADVRERFPDYRVAIIAVRAR